MKSAIEQAIIEREYVVTTPESLQSLELKLIELLSDKGADNQALIAQQVPIITRILNRIKQGTPIVDEVDKALSVKRLLNYTVGVGEPLKPEIFVQLIYNYMILCGMLKVGAGSDYWMLSGIQSLHLERMTGKQY